jgi:N-acetyltransferase
MALHVTLEGRRVRLEPLVDHHHGELFEISRDPRIWALQRVRADESMERFDEWYASVEMGFAHYFDDRLVGHTSYGNDEPHNRAVEVGNTWLVPDAWSSGANAEAKYLLLRHAFEDEGYHRVSFKTESTNARSRALSPRCRRSSRASSASTCSSEAASGATRPGTPSSTTTGPR